MYHSNLNLSTENQTPKTEIMRAFIAIALNQELHTDILLLQRRLDKYDLAIRWVNPTNMHLTLQFLGDINNQELKTILSSLADAVNSHQSFSLSLSGIGVFPDLCCPRVMWAGIEKGKKECISLQKDIEGSVNRIKVKKENRTFSPHLTIGRFITKNHKPDIGRIIEKERNFHLKALAPVNAIMLFESILTPKGAIHKIVEKFPLR